MTNNIPDGLQWTSGAALPGFVIHESLPWSTALLLCLWLASSLALIAGVILGLVRKRKNRPTAPLSTTCLMISTGILFGGSGIILWDLATALSDLISISAPSRTLLQFTGLTISSSLYCLGLNSILAGIGFLASIALREKATKLQ